MADLGQAALIVALALAAYAVVALVVGVGRRDGRWVKSGQEALRGAFACTTLAALALVTLLVRSDFSVAYVARTTSQALPLFYKVTAFWGGQAGSILLWLWIQLACAVMVERVHRGEGRELVPHAQALLAGLAVFFLVLVGFVSRPFATLEAVPADGAGLNPLLQHPMMAAHPLHLYAGFIGFSVPWAFAMAALWKRARGDTWIRITRKWTLAAWLILSWGILWGARWAYEVLGWGGYWAWDPVENASLLPWLTATAFLHSVMVQERRGMLKGWNVGLISATFVLTLFGTLVTRSGLLASVHAFARSPIGPWFVGLLLGTIAVTVWLIATRAALLRDDRQFESVVSKETSFLLNNLVIAGWAFAIFWGILYPLVMEALRGVQLSVGPPFYNQVSVPLVLTLLFLMGVGPLIAWRRSSWRHLASNFGGPLAAAFVVVAGLLAVGVRRPGVVLALWGCAFVAATVFFEYVRAVRVRMRATGEGAGRSLIRLAANNRRRYGGYVVHLGFLVMVAAISLHRGYEAGVDWAGVVPGQVLQLPGGTSLAFTRLYARDVPHLQGAVTAEVRVLRDGRPVGTVYPEKRFHKNTDFTGNNVTTEVAILSSWWRDIYVVLVGWSEDGATASFRVNVNPAVAWIWMGAYVMTLGAVWALWPNPVSSGVPVARVARRSRPARAAAAPSTPASPAPGA